MSYDEFCLLVEKHQLTGGTYDETIDLLALVGMFWFQQARAKLPGLTLDDVADSLFDEPELIQ